MIDLLFWAGTALLGAAVGVALVAFWDNIVNWFKEIWNELPESVRQDLKSIAAFVVSANEGLFGVLNNYLYNERTKKWTEKTYTREIDPSELPENIRNQLARNSAVDVTDELLEKLKLTN